MAYRVFQSPIGKGGLSFVQEAEHASLLKQTRIRSKATLTSSSKLGKTSPCGNERSLQESMLRGWVAMHRSLHTPARSLGTLGQPLTTMTPSPIATLVRQQAKEAFHSTARAYSTSGTGIGVGATVLNSKNSWSTSKIMAALLATGSVTATLGTSETEASPTSDAAMDAEGAFHLLQAAAEEKTQNGAKEGKNRLFATFQRKMQGKQNNEGKQAVAPVSKEKAEKKHPAAYDYSAHGSQGLRSYMEDQFSIGDGGRFAAIFDGHGGADVANVLRDSLYDAFKKYLEEGMKGHDGSWLGGITTRVNALHAAFDEVEDDIMANDELEGQGSTAVVVVLHEQENGHRTLVSANVGDSRAVLSRNGKAIDLTQDHKPEDDVERRRIEAMGESIKWDDLGHTYRVRNLCVSRSIGDRHAKPVVSGEVEVKGLDIVDDQDEFVILASDGVWDVMTSQEAVSFVHKKMTDAKKRGAPLDFWRKQMSELVNKEALRRFSADNVSCVIVWLDEL